MTLPSVVKDLLILAPSFRRVPYCPAIRMIHAGEKGERRSVLWLLLRLAVRYPRDQREISWILFLQPSWFAGHDAFA